MAKCRTGTRPAHYALLLHSELTTYHFSQPPPPRRRNAAVACPGCFLEVPQRPQTSLSEGLFCLSAPKPWMQIPSVAAVYRHVENVNRRILVAIPCTPAARAAALHHAMQLSLHWFRRRSSLRVGDVVTSQPARALTICILHRREALAAGTTCAELVCCHQPCSYARCQCASDQSARSRLGPCSAD